MEQRIDCLGLLFLLTYFSYATTNLTHCEARKSLKHPKGLQIKVLKHLGTYSSSDPNSPYYMPPYEDVMGPSPSPIENPGYCIYPPLTPLPPSPTLPTPILPIQNPPPPPISTNPPVLTPRAPEFPSPSPPETVPSPPEYQPSPHVMGPSPSPIDNPGYCNYPPLTPLPPSPTLPTPILPIQNPPPPPISTNPPILTPSPPEFPSPSPPEAVPSPPEYQPSPPSYAPSPPEYVPGPPEFIPGPPFFLPPVVYPPPAAPPPPPVWTGPVLWCVAKPTVPEPIIQEAMDYACGLGADCDAIQPNGSCYQPDTVIAHASFAFNSYWQRTKAAGGTCDFGGTAMLITKDPSYDGCHFTLV